MQITLTLPIPAREVSPNAARGQSRWAAIKKSKLVKAHRWEAMAAMNYRLAIVEGYKAIGYSLEHYFPTYLFRDEDNADGACKAYRDGICDALGMDDRNFNKLKLSTRGKDAKNPRVEVTIYFGTNIEFPPNLQDDSIKQVELERDTFKSWAHKFRDLLSPFAWLHGVDSPNEAEKAIMQFDNETKTGNPTSPEHEVDKIEELLLANA